MLLQILKKDMMKRKGINAILFLFITLATVFLSSSVNNIMIVSSGIEYYIEYANVPDINIVLSSEQEKDKIQTWVDKQQENGDVSASDYNALYILPSKAIKCKSAVHTKGENFESDGVSLYLGTTDANYSKVFDQQGKEFQLANGEVALSTPMMERNHLKVGDTFILESGTYKKEFKIKVEMKDAAFGNDMVGMSRIIVNEQEFHQIEEKNEGNFSKIGLFYIDVTKGSKFLDNLNQKGYASIVNNVERDTYKMVYTFDMIMAALLILIGVCLILISLLVLRFTLVFTMEEQYQEIGILKAIGLRDFQIKKLYLIKYLAIVSVGAFLGLLISLPISRLMIESVSNNIIMASGEINLGINLLCALLIVLLVLFFCYSCTRKLNKISAIMAIHGGNSGESFTKSGGLCLSKRLHMPIALYLGMNDILKHMKRYAVLIITFCISFILITIPLNTLNTMSSKEMLYKFLLDPKSAVYVRDVELESEGKYTSAEQLVKGTNRLSNELKNIGYQNKITSEAIFFLNYREGEHGANHKVMSIQILGENAEFAQYSEGSAPHLKNEIAFSEKILEKHGWNIGDYITTTINGKEQQMIITGTYSDYMQMGESARLNSVIDMGEEILFDYWCIMVNLQSEKSQVELVQEFNVSLPDYEWMSGQETIDKNIGGIQVMLKQLLFPMTAMLCLIIMLITLLMEKLFITREKGEIAMMNSIGFRYQAICNWQIARMCMVVFTSMIISIPLSFVSNQFLLKPIFAIMGADVNIQVDALRVYLIYPSILLVGIIMATILAVHGIKKINIHEINNLE